MNRGSQVYVAVVDDDDSYCRSLGRFLRAAGFQPVSYGSAEALLADAKRPQFDCLVLDIQLDKMSGIELSRHLRSEGSAVPVIFNTAHDEPAIRARALQTGCAAYLRKTDPGEAMLAAIQNAIDHNVDGEVHQAEGNGANQGEP